MLQNGALNIANTITLEKSVAINVPQREKSSKEYLIKTGFEVKQINKSDEDLWLKMGQLRADVYVRDNSYLPPEVLDGNGAEYDEYDEYSDHIVAVDDNNNVIGTIRVVHRDKNGKLPCEKMFDVNFPDGDPVEVSRVMVDPGVPMSHKSLISVSLLRAAIKTAPEGEEHSYAIVEPSMHRYLDDIIGIKCKTVIGSTYIKEYNSNNSLVEMDSHRMVSQIHERDKQKKRPLKGLPEKLAPFFEQNATNACLGRVALNEINSPSPEQFDRNLGFISQVEHEHLQTSTVAIAGAGGDGGELAVALAQLGVGKFRIADPEVFEVNNLNRQAGASYKTIGRNKAEVIAEKIKDINPYAEVEIFTDGVTLENVVEFIKGSNLIIDETEFTHHEIGVMIARKAREYKLPVLMTMNVGFGAYTTSFDPNGKTFESYLGLDEKASLEEIAKKEVHLSKWVPHIPTYSDMTAFQKVASNEVKTPSVAPGVKMAVAEASTQALAHLLKDITPERSRWIYYAPRGKSIDTIDGVNMINFPRAHFLSSVAIASLRTFFHKNPRAGY